jgi:hypothetical protein
MPYKHNEPRPSQDPESPVPGGELAGVRGRAAPPRSLTRYNEIVDEFETDPSLKIEFKQ